MWHVLVCCSHVGSVLVVELIALKNSLIFLRHVLLSSSCVWSVCVIEMPVLGRTCKILGHSWTCSVPLGPDVDSHLLWMYPCAILVPTFSAGLPVTTNKGMHLVAVLFLAASVCLPCPKVWLTHAVGVIVGASEAFLIPYLTRSPMLTESLS